MRGFRGKEVTKKKELGATCGPWSLAWQPTASEGDAALTIDIGGKVDISLKSQEFAQAVFDVYLGDGPVSPGALDAFKAGAAKL